MLRPSLLLQLQLTLLLHLLQLHVPQQVHLLVQHLRLHLRRQFLQPPPQQVHLLVLHVLQFHFLRQCLQHQPLPQQVQLLVMHVLQFHFPRQCLRPLQVLLLLQHQPQQVHLHVQHHRILALKPALNHMRRGSDGPLRGSAGSVPPNEGFSERHLLCGNISNHVVLESVIPHLLSLSCAKVHTGDAVLYALHGPFYSFQEFCF